MIRDYSVITHPYDQILQEVKISAECDGNFSYWFCDKDDDATALSKALKRDLSAYNPRDLCLSGILDKVPGYCKDPWYGEIIPYANRLSQEGIEKAIIMLRTERIPKGNETMFLRELVRGIDWYIEQAGNNRRYPLILTTQQNHLQIFLNNTEETFPNWGGFKSRQQRIAILARTS